MKKSKKLSKEYMEYLSFITKRKKILNNDRSMRADLKKSFMINRNIKKGLYQSGGQDET